MTIPAGHGSLSLQKETTDETESGTNPLAAAKGYLLSDGGSDNEKQPPEELAAATDSDDDNDDNDEGFVGYGGQDRPRSAGIRSGRRPHRNQQTGGGHHVDSGHSNGQRWQYNSEGVNTA